MFSKDEDSLSLYNFLRSLIRLIVLTVLRSLIDVLILHMRKSVKAVVLVMASEREASKK